jgi:preprotein translocase SecE subunit
MERTAMEKSTTPVKRNSKTGNVFKRIKDWLISCKTMCKKIIWPKPKTVLRNFLIVLIVSAILVLIIWGLDYIFTTLVTFILSLFAG